MFKLFRKKRNLAPTDAEERQLEIDRVNALLKEQMREWQLNWHDLYDADSELALTNEHLYPKPIPANLDGDYRLIFELSRLSAETRRACFGLLPKGDEMFARFEAYRLSRSRPKLSEAEAREAAQTIGLIIEELGTNTLSCFEDSISNLDFSTLRILDRNADSFVEEIAYADRIERAARLSSDAPTTVQNLEIHAAKLFLSEPLYISSGNWYYLGNHVTGVSFGQNEDCFHTAIYKLWLGGWDMFFDGDGVILTHFDPP